MHCIFFWFEFLFITDHTTNMLRITYTAQASLRSSLIILICTSNFNISDVSVQRPLRKVKIFFPKSIFDVFRIFAYKYRSIAEYFPSPYQWNSPT